MEKVFIDTNIIIYANDKRDKKKQTKALKVVTDLMKSNGGTISIQVLQEYAFVALKKLNQKHDVVLRHLNCWNHLKSSGNQQK